jgi:hypothetical protein
MNKLTNENRLVDYHSVSTVFCIFVFLPPLLLTVHISAVQFGTDRFVPCQPFTVGIGAIQRQNARQEERAKVLG